ncbi:hypothetical protein EG347_00940 [Chryseobacterium sp. G0186]|uniref:hypothetical protein n=1 Tax=Chryseobacterium sp. G0186 TaxID=2487064 RepID=UPI000F50BAC0|nr:hypothetical protein [Chryseobacterium sp. G0186]AZA76193.1 hypothetical protein EG347_00940 [Chryseobacterium sp. G0186]
MQGIEPKLHTSLMGRMECFRVLLQEAMDDVESQSSDIWTQISELNELYEDYLLNKKNLENSIKNYRDYHNNLRRKLTVKLREARKKAREKS